MKVNKVIAIPALALAAGLSLTACGGGTTSVPGTSTTQAPSAPAPSDTGMAGGSESESQQNSDQTPAPAAQKTLTRIQKTGGGGAAGWSTTDYNNYWSDGSVTSCTVTTFPNGTVSGTGNCAPDGVANGMTGGNAPGNSVHEAQPVPLHEGQ